MCKRALSHPAPYGGVGIADIETWSFRCSSPLSDYFGENLEVFASQPQQTNTRASAGFPGNANLPIGGAGRKPHSPQSNHDNYTLAPAARCASVKVGGVSCSAWRQRIGGLWGEADRSHGGWNSAKPPVIFRQFPDDLTRHTRTNGIACILLKTNNPYVRHSTL